MGGSRLENLAVEWETPGPGTYLFTAIGLNNEGLSSKPTQLEITILSEVDWIKLAKTPANTPQDVPILKEKTDIEPGTAEGESQSDSDLTTEDSPVEPIGIVLQNVYCRQGPGSEYDAIATLIPAKRCIRIKTSWVPRTKK